MLVRAPIGLGNDLLGSKTFMMPMDALGNILPTSDI